MRSALRLIDASGRPIDGLSEAVTFASSEGLGWSGLFVESGHNDHWDADSLSSDAHFIGLNTASTRLNWEARVNGGFQTVGTDPGEFWFCPAGESFTHRVATPSDFILVKIDPQSFRRWTGGAPVSLGLRYGVGSPQIEHLSRALAAEAQRRSPNGRLFREALGAALSMALAQSIGSPVVSELQPLGQLSPDRLRRVTDYVEAHLGTDLSVDELAGVALYSSAHFSRAFKSATGRSPHQYVLERRLQRAREMLIRGQSAAVVAAGLGFTDQSHFTKCFRKAFNITPGQLAKR